MIFKDLSLSNEILRAIDVMGHSHATHIQQQAIPLVLGGFDVIGCAQTGTGKTGAFSIPILEVLGKQKKQQKNAIKALVLAPTRELAIQIDESFKMYGKFLPLKHTAIFGGVSQANQIKVLSNGIDVLIATPGRLLDLIKQGYVDVSKIEILVLDEADHMLDMGFINDIKKILKFLPEKKQSLFFSATMPNEIKKFASSILNNPKEVYVAPVSSTAETVKQELYFVDKIDKSNLLIELLNKKKGNQSLVFTRTKHGADKLVRKLLKVGIKASAIHGNKSQGNRQRVLSDFKRNNISVLIATDIAARGIDIDNLPYVINYELPNIPETYVHRIGRTGRAGLKGIAVSFCDKQETKELIGIQKLLGFNIPVIVNN